jgi:hypothetical protein
MLEIHAAVVEKHAKQILNRERVYAKVSCGKHSVATEVFFPLCIETSEFTSYSTGRATIACFLARVMNYSG